MRGNWKKELGRFYGIQGRFLKYTLLLLAAALLFSGIGVGIVVRKNVNTSMADKFKYLNRQIAVALEAQFKITDDLMEKCILYEDVQDSLSNKELSKERQMMLKQYLSYTNYRYFTDYIYVDNKQNSYTKPYRNVDTYDLANSGLIEKLGNSYSKTTWIWSQDKLFHTKENTLYVGRYVRNMEYQHQPGILMFKANPAIFSDILTQVVEKEEGSFGIATKEGMLCSLFEQGKNPISKSTQNEILQLIGTTDFANSQYFSENLKEGVVIGNIQPETEFVLFSFVPNQILNRVLLGVYATMAAICLLVMGGALIVSIYFARRFTSPITEISSAMAEFKGVDFHKTLHIQTKTELDAIGESYNLMLRTIEKQVEEIRQQEKNIRVSELNSLMYQINPHFLYNTLDTIYMLARINKEETTMTMIQSLSTFLKVSLSKGIDVITLEDELSHVRSYMEIQKIRNDNLFQYEMICPQELEKMPVLKLIIQPIVENSIKHGFSQIYSGGFIEIRAYEEEEFLGLRIYNNGISMEESMREKINQTKDMTVKEIGTLFEHQKNGYGITNVICRLRLKYGNRSQFYFKSIEEGTLCVIKIPKAGEEDELL